MARNGMVPSVTLKGARVPFSRFAAFAPHKVQMKEDEVTGTTVPDWDPTLARTSTPAAREAAVALARKSRAVVKTARPFGHPIIPTGRRVG